MSMTTELVDKLRYIASILHDDESSVIGKSLVKTMREAADTIELLSEKLHASQMERSSQFYNGGWIPVSERLPKEDGDYFVTLENGVVTKLGYSTTQRTTYPKGFYYISGGFSWRQTINPVIAWMPLPEPYQLKEGE